VELAKADLFQRVQDTVRFIAFRGAGPGRGMLCPEYNINRIYPEDVAEYILQRTWAHNITVVGNVVDHGAFVEGLRATFDHFEQIPAIESNDNEIISRKYYTGGTRFDTGHSEAIYVEAYPCLGNTPHDRFVHGILLELMGDLVRHEIPLPGNRRDKILATALRGCNFIRRAQSYVLPNIESLFCFQVIGRGFVKDVAAKIRECTTRLRNITEDEFYRARDIVIAKNSLNSENREILNIGLAEFARYDFADFKTTTFRELKSIVETMLNSHPTIYASGNLHGMRYT